MLFCYNVSYGAMTCMGLWPYFLYSFLRNHILRSIYFSNSIFKLLNKDFIFLFSLFFFIFLIERFRNRPRFLLMVNFFFFYSFLYAIFNTLFILYTKIFFNLIYLPFLCIFQILKKLFYYFDYYIYNIMVAFCVSHMRIMRSI